MDEVNGPSARARHSEIVDSFAQIGARIKAMVINQDKEKGRFSLSTKSLEPEPGDMVRNPQAVFDQVYSYLCKKFLCCQAGHLSLSRRICPAPPQTIFV